MSWNVQVLGGPRDGEVVPHSGRWLRLPRPRAHSFLASPIIALPDVSSTWVDEYRFERGLDGEMYYVLVKGKT